MEMPASQLTNEEFVDIISRMSPDQHRAVEDAMVAALGAGALMAVLSDQSKQIALIEDLFSIHPALKIPPKLEKAMARLREGMDD